MRQVYLLTWLMALLLLKLNLLVKAQDVSGVWQGVNYAPSSLDTPYWPLSLTLNQSNSSVEGQCLEINGAKSQYYSLWELTNGTVQNNKGSFDLIKSKQQTREFLTYWCTGAVSFTYYPDEEKILGIATYSNCDWQGNFELYRLALKSPRTYCKGQAINLVITGKNVSWYLDKDKKTLLSQGNTFSPNLTQTTTFYVTQTNYETESPAVPITIEIIDIAVQGPTITNASCGKNNGVISLTVAADSSIRYSLNNGLFQTSPVFQNLSPSTYTITIKDQHNCRAEKQSIINQQPLPQLSVTRVNRTCSEEGMISVAATNGLLPYQYSLDSISFQSDYRFKVSPNSYTIYVRDANNCIVEDTVTIKNICLPNLFAPEAFTPNEDGQNDIFMLLKPFYQTVLLTIYDRWGEIILQTDKAEWDGLHNGIPCPEGVYTWQAELFEEGNVGQGIRLGRVVLIR